MSSLGPTTTSPRYLIVHMESGNVETIHEPSKASSVEKIEEFLINYGNSLSDNQLNLIASKTRTSNASSPILSHIHFISTANQSVKLLELRVKAKNLKDSLELIKNEAMLKVEQELAQTLISLDDQKVALSVKDEEGILSITQIKSKLNEMLLHNTYSKKVLDFFKKARDVIKLAADFLEATAKIEHGSKFAHLVHESRELIHQKRRHDQKVSEINKAIFEKSDAASQIINEAIELREKLHQRIKFMKTRGIEIKALRKQLITALQKNLAQVVQEQKEKRDCTTLSTFFDDLEYLQMAKAILDEAHRILRTPKHVRHQSDHPILYPIPLRGRDLYENNKGKSATEIDVENITLQEFDRMMIKVIRSIINKNKAKTELVDKHEIECEKRIARLINYHLIDIIMNENPNLAHIENLEEELKKKVRLQIEGDDNYPSYIDDTLLGEIFTNPLVLKALKELQKEPCS